MLEERSDEPRMLYSPMKTEAPDSDDDAGSALDDYLMCVKVEVKLEIKAENGD